MWCLWSWRTVLVGGAAFEMYRRARQANAARHALNNPSGSSGGGEGGGTPTLPETGTTRTLAEDDDDGTENNQIQVTGGSSEEGEKFCPEKLDPIFCNNDKEQVKKDFLKQMLAKGVDPEAVDYVAKFDPNKLSPQDKAAFDSQLAALQEEAFGGDLEADFAMEEPEEVEESDFTSEFKQSANSGAPAPAPFVARKSRSKTKKGSMADKVKRMLAGMVGSKNVKKKDKPKPVTLGKDLVGGKEDNIFIQVHTRHRKMDEQGAFL